MVVLKTVNNHMIYADRLGGSNGDGAKRHIVKTPDLAHYEKFTVRP
jgi:hypothetical protein